MDFEASSLGLESFPVEVGWCDVFGVGASYMIQPQATWSDWDDASERIHGLSKDTLLKSGLPADDVARRYAEAAHGKRLYCNGLLWDQAWSDILLTTAGLPLRRLRPVRDLYGLAMKRLRATPSDGVSKEDLISDAEARAKTEHPVLHRALADAQHLAFTCRLLMHDYRT